MLKKTPLYPAHIAAHAKMVDFAGWEMPLHYGSQLDEHHQVRDHVGMFDVSHMGVVDCYGPDAAPYLRQLLANNIDRLTNGRALYTCMLNHAGGVIDDLIVYRLNENFFRIIVNAGTREKDLQWMREQQTGFDLTLKERLDVAMIAIQGPLAKEKMFQLFRDISNQLDALRPFNFITFNDTFIARTGYTGEDGFEVILPATDAISFWQACLNAGILPCGLGARDTLRLEAGLNLYGADMNEDVTPLESNLAWTVVFEPDDRAFNGRDVLLKQKQEGTTQRLVGLVLEGPGIIRNHQKVLFNDEVIGEVTSGGFSPTLGKSIALARITGETGPSCFVEIRNKPIAAQVIKPPFVRHGKQVF